MNQTSLRLQIFRSVGRLLGIALVAALSPLPVRAMDVMAWVPPYAIGACQTVVTSNFGEFDAKDGLTRVGLQFWVPNSDGTIKYATHESYIPKDSDVVWWRNWCRDNNIKLLLTIYNNTGKWNWSLALSAFGNNRAVFVNALVTEMDRLGLDGIDLDLEGTGRLDGDRAAFAAFVNDLSAQVKARGKILTVDSFHYIWNAPNQNWWPDWLGKVDQIHSMGYDDLYEGGSGYHKYSFQQNAATSAGFPASAILMGFPSWVDSWGVTSGRGTSTLAHLGEVQYDLLEPAGIAIWDLQLSASSWRSSAVWQEIAALKAINGDSPVNDEPVANSQSVVTTMNTPVAITLTGSDIEGDPLTYFIDELPSHGTVQGTAYNAVTYTPAPNWGGVDSFTFVVNDGQLDSAPATVTIGVSGAIGPLPNTWSSMNVGNTGLGGSAGYDAAIGRFYLAGAGTGLTGTSDSLYYTWQTMSGDGEIRARLTAMNNVPVGAVAGVMIRETTATGSAHHFFGRRNDGVFVWVRRNSTGRSTSLATGGASNLPCWVRLVRTGTTITAYQSANGTSWTKINNAKISMASQVTIGLAVSSSSSTAILNAVFDSVQVVP